MEYTNETSATPENAGGERVRPKLTDAQRELLARWYLERVEALTLFAKRKVGFESAREIVAEAFRKLGVALCLGKTPANVGAWLYATVGNACVDDGRAAIRRKTRLVSELGTDADGKSADLAEIEIVRPSGARATVDDPAREVERKEERIVFDRNVKTFLWSRFSEDEQATYRNCFDKIPPATLEEIAAELDVTVENARTIRRRMTRKIEEYFASLRRRENFAADANVSARGLGRNAI